ncbi:hypothetical protein GE21DRAFT_1844 [Neurospora crassa]|uniref:Regulatory P domain-containing protein n=1 Tax=Neurospora crassa (strain ATCC 24698 / 74-OR23-1A / CBS 708.71 / DSM 1257 / FGSC 987) TaxID=367110 RepID=Q7SFH0_NEUCR|nr:hypothetical protein NCU00861 [Neurospora crassa OR74A]EAA35541.3 hypothetical protein NCU00861 [Neurospora crassa OR74A]KHE82181.1 hypothetical protein GE21DRAFT_1844 [Neurospora crassa]|eukprot:XP_964777.3 hypothetical protein NCU00861 [Neurospora crassa OR74A]
MRLKAIVIAVGFCAVGAQAKEKAVDMSRHAEYESGTVMDRIMAHKFEQWKIKLASGALNNTQWPRLSYTKCVNGFAEAVQGDALHTFRCKNMDLYDFINHATIGSPLATEEGATGSSIWGWTDPRSGREFIAVGMYQGTGLAEILPKGRLLVLGFLPAPAALGQHALWKEIRAYKNYMIIGSELEDHGIQIFDMRKLLTINPKEAPVTFSIDDVTGHFKDLPLGRTHNVVVNEELQYAVSVGAVPREDACGAGLIFIDLKDPSKPTRLGCNAQDGYVHDAQCIRYRGPDKRYLGHDICYGYNEDSLTIYDVTNKANSSIISRTSYDGASYTHQGWVLDPLNQEYLLLDDEYDERDAVGPAKDGYPVTYIWDIRDLQNLKNTGFYKATNRGIDHNQYVIDGLSYQSSYGAGVRVYDVSSIPADPTGTSVCEVAYFDIYPEDDAEPGGGTVEFAGSWASYGYFKSGFIAVNTFERGVYLVKITKRERCQRIYA